MSARIFRAEEPKLLVSVAAEACLLAIPGAVEALLPMSGGEPTEGGM